MSSTIDSSLMAYTPLTSAVCLLPSSNYSRKKVFCRQAQLMFSLFTARRLYPRQEVRDSCCVMQITHYLISPLSPNEIVKCFLSQAYTLPRTGSFVLCVTRTQKLETRWCVHVHPFNEVENRAQNLYA